MFAYIINTPIENVKGKIEKGKVLFRRIPYFSSGKVSRLCGIEPEALLPFLNRYEGKRV